MLVNVGVNRNENKLAGVLQHSHDGVNFTCKMKNSISGHWMTDQSVMTQPISVLSTTVETILLIVKLGIP